MKCANVGRWSKILKYGRPQQKTSRACVRSSKHRCASFKPSIIPPAQIEGALQSVYGVDSQLIADGTYLLAGNYEFPRPLRNRCLWRMEQAQNFIRRRSIRRPRRFAARSRTRLRKNPCLLRPPKLGTARHRHSDPRSLRERCQGSGIYAPRNGRNIKRRDLLSDQRLRSNRRSSRAIGERGNPADCEDGERASGKKLECRLRKWDISTSR